jgi:addiction module RelB/DinJ family antitoxin
MIDKINRFKELGFKVWMDDYGSGYSSPMILQKVPFDLIKIDMQFVRQLEEGERAKIILTELVRMAMSLGMDTVAEGVETKEQAELILAELGIPMSNAVGMFLKQVVIQRGIPFEMKLPSARPLVIGEMTREQFNAEMQAGLDDIQAGRVVSADDVEAEMRRMYGA